MKNHFFKSHTTDQIFDYEPNPIFVDRKGNLVSKVEAEIQTRLIMDSDRNSMMQSIVEV